MNAEIDYDTELCGKWTILCELLEVWKRNGDKVLLFSNSLKGEPSLSRRPWSR